MSWCATTLAREIARVTVHGRGRIQLPSAIRTVEGIKDGDTIRFLVEDDRYYLEKVEKKYEEEWQPQQKPEPKLYKGDKA